MLLTEAVAKRLNLNPSEIYGKNLTLKDVLSMSPSCINSIDIMEAFAGAIADVDFNGDPSLPMFTMDSQLDVVISEIKVQLNCEVQS